MTFWTSDKTWTEHNAGPSYNQVAPVRDIEYIMSEITFTKLKSMTVTMFLAFSPYVLTSIIQWF